MPLYFYIKTALRKGAAPVTPVAPPPTPPQPTAPSSPSAISAPVSPSVAPQENAKTPPAPESTPPAPKQSENIAFEKQSANDAPAAEEPAAESQPGLNLNITIEMVLDKWAQILEGVKPLNHSIHAFLKNCVPAGIIKNQLYIKAKYDFYKDKLNEPSNRLTVGQVIAKIMQGDLKVTFATEKDCENLDFSQAQSSQQTHNILHDAMQMMGGRIVD